MPTLAVVDANTRILRDNSVLHSDDYDIGDRKNWRRKKKKEHRGFRGEVTIGRNLSVDPKTGLSKLGEIIARKKPNEILMGGSIYALEKMFNVPCSVNVEYLNNIMNIGTTGQMITEKYPRANGICLWTVGLGGCGDSRKDIKHVYQQQRQLDQIIPFRVVDVPFAAGTPEASTYALMKRLDDGRCAYYGKTFARDVVIKPLWKDAAKDQDGSEVVESDYTSKRDTPIEVFAECVCVIDKEDFREWFDLYDNIDEVRFNEIGLCCGIKSREEDGREEYKQVRQLSCCHFTNEPLHMEKDMSIIYRWYSA